MNTNSSLLKTLKWEMMLKASDDEYDSDATCCENSETYNTIHQVPQRDITPDSSIIKVQPTPAIHTTSYQGIQQNSERDYYAQNLNQNDFLAANSIDKTGNITSCKTINVTKLDDKFERESYFGFTDLTLSVNESMDTGVKHRFESDFNFTDIYEKEVAGNFLAHSNAETIHCFDSNTVSGKYLVESNKLEYLKNSLPAAGCLTGQNVVTPTDKYQLSFPLEEQRSSVINSNEKENLNPYESYVYNLNWLAPNTNFVSNKEESLNDLNIEIVQECNNVKNNSKTCTSGEFDSDSEDLQEVNLQIANFLKEYTENNRLEAVEGNPMNFNTVENSDMNNGQIQETLPEQNNDSSKNDDEEFLIGLTQNMNQIAECDPLIGSNGLSNAARPCSPPLKLNPGVRRKVLPADKKLPNYKRKQLPEPKVLPARKCSSAFIDPLHRASCENDIDVNFEKRCNENNLKGKTRKNISENKVITNEAKKIKTVQQKSSKGRRKKKKHTSTQEVQPCKKEVFYPDEALQKVQEFLEEIEGFMTCWLSGSDNVDPPSRDQVFHWFANCQLWKIKLDEYKKRIEKGRRFTNRKQLMLKERTLSERLNQLSTLIDKTITECDQAVEQETQDDRDSREASESSVDCRSQNDSSSDNSQTEILRYTNPKLKIKYGPPEVNKPILKVSSTENQSSEESSAKEKHITFSDEIEYKYLSGSELSSPSIVRESQSFVVENHNNVGSIVIEEEMDFKSNSPPNETESNLSIDDNEAIMTHNNDNKNSTVQSSDEFVEGTNPETLQNFFPVMYNLPSTNQNSKGLGTSWNFKDKPEILTFDLVSNKITSRGMKQSYSHNNQSPTRSIPYVSTSLHNTNCSGQQFCQETSPKTHNKEIQTGDIVSEVHNNRQEVQVNEELSMLTDGEYVDKMDINHNKLINSECLMNQRLLKMNLNAQPKSRVENSSQTKPPKEIISGTPSSTSCKQECSISESLGSVNPFTHNSIGSQSEGFGFSEVTPFAEDESIRETIMSIKFIRIKDPVEYMSASEVDPDNFDDLDKWENDN